MFLLGSVLMLWVVGALSPLVIKLFGYKAGWGLSLFPFGVCLWIALQDPSTVLVESMPWYSALGASLDFRLDGMGRLMGLLVTGIGGMIILYACGYLSKAPVLGSFLLILFAFMGSMLGLVLSDNIIVLFVFWELTSITSYLLIGYHHESLESRKKALQALIVTGLGGLALLAGLVLLGFTANAWTLTELTEHQTLITESSFYPTILILVLLGAFTKSAQFPFHFWLPNAMAAPTPVSAYLHSATMVKAGVFLLAVMSPILGGTASWQTSLMFFGGVTFLLGAIRGLFKTDLKSILAYTTISVLGLLVLLIGLDFKGAAQAAVLFLLAHALYKGSLFMVAGIIDHETGTRDVTRLAGLGKLMPITAAAGLLAALSSAGFPPFLGFLGKEYVYKAGLEIGILTPTFIIIAVAGNALLLALGFKAGLHPFFSKGVADTPKKPHEAPILMWLGPISLAVTGTVLGIFPGLISSSLISPALSSIRNAPLEVEISLWHGINLPLILSVVTVALGISLYLSRRYFWKWSQSDAKPMIPEAENIYNATLDGVIRFSKWQTRVLQSGKLRNYLLIIISSIAALLTWKLGATFTTEIQPPSLELSMYLVPLIILMIASTIFIVASNSKATALLGLGILGFGIAIIFAYYSAPDLAITQIVVETLTIVLLFLTISRLPQMRRISAKRTIWVDAGIAAVVGILASILVIQATLVQLSESISGQMGDWSYTIAKGKNVVNVILVDFRALDTFGEIAVLAIAALGIGILMAKKGSKES